jgi:hypothetical protein
MRLGGILGKALSGPIRVLCVALVYGAIVLTTIPCDAETAPGYDASMPQPGPYEEKLDVLLAAHDTDALNRAILFDVKDLNTATHGLDWLRAKQIVSGGSSHIAYLYSALSWRVSDSLPEPHKSNLKQNAVAQMILARWLIQSEGFQCADAGAPGARLALLNSQLKTIADYGQKIPQPDAATIMRNMFLTMMLSFKKRENDVWLCRGGLRYLAKYFEKHPDEKGTDVSVPGSVGANKMLPVDPTIMPDFVPYDNWKDKRHAVLDSILKQTGGNPTTNYLDTDHRVK